MLAYTKFACVHTCGTNRSAGYWSLIVTVLVSSGSDYHSHLMLVYISQEPNLAGNMSHTPIGLDSFMIFLKVPIKFVWSKKINEYETCLAR